MSQRQTQQVKKTDKSDCQRIHFQCEMQKFDFLLKSDASIKHSIFSLPRANRYKMTGQPENGIYEEYKQKMVIRGLREFFVIQHTHTSKFLSEE